ncbi:MAG: DUF2891 domain-containing protein [Acidobacteria bacterium]|nr:DUF2891 domain-containing protein [Acidobacteriota bacterium]
MLLLNPRATAATVDPTATAGPGETPGTVGTRATFDAGLAQRFADLALACVAREYPNKISHVLNAPADATTPCQLTPAFCGCLDWHSAVHGHWLLARLARTFPEAAFAAPARAALAASLTPEKIAAEVRYLQAPNRSDFERPYGLAWLLQLATELRQWDDPQARGWAKTIAPLERAAVERLTAWLPKLSLPIRSGEHSQTAFAFGLIADWARVSGDATFAELLRERIQTFYGNDRGCPLGYEPSGQDFLSPCLAEADLMRRILEPTRFGAWFGAFLPAVPFDGSAAWLEPAVVTDVTDGKLAHLDGLNLSRAWMLEGIAAGLPLGDPRIAALRAASARHRESGLAAVTGAHYEGGHWLGSFATYLVTARGLH